MLRAYAESLSPPIGDEEIEDEDEDVDDEDIGDDD